MRLITNPELIKRNSTIGRTASGAGIIILLSGLVFPYVLPLIQQRFFPGGTLPDLTFVPLITLLVGFLLSNVGIAYSNRWVRPPRPDEALDAALKGLDDRHVLYHYRLPASHVLVAPSGVYVLVPKRQGGDIGYADGKWRHSGQNRLFSFFGQEGIGNPLAEVAGEVTALNNFLEKNLPGNTVPLKGIVVFTNLAATVNASDPPLPVLHTKQLKEYIRRQPKGPTLPAAALTQLNQLLKIDTTRPAEA